MRLAIDSRKAQLQAFIERASQPDVPEEVQSQLFKFGAILLCGHIERCIELIILHRLQGRAQERVLAFVKSHFKRGANYDCSAIKQLLERFDPTWANRFQRFIDENDDVREAILSAYAVRNPIAHGSSGGIGGARLKALVPLMHRLVDGVIDCTA